MVALSLGQSPMGPWSTTTPGGDTTAYWIWNVSGAPRWELHDERSGCSDYKPEQDDARFSR